MMSAVDMSKKIYFNFSYVLNNVLNAWSWREDYTWRLDPERAECVQSDCGVTAERVE